MEEKATARHVAAAFLKPVWKYHELFTEIISDVNTKFAAEFWESWWKNIGTKEKKATVYHHQTDIQMERVHPVLGGYLPIFINYNQNNWYYLVPLAEFAYNN